MRYAPLLLLLLATASLHDTMATKGVKSTPASAVRARPQPSLMEKAKARALLSKRGRSKQSKKRKTRGVVAPAAPVLGPKSTVARTNEHGRDSSVPPAKKRTPGGAKARSGRTKKKKKNATSFTADNNPRLKRVGYPGGKEANKFGGPLPKGAADAGFKILRFQSATNKKNVESPNGSLLQQGRSERTRQHLGAYGFHYEEGTPPKFMLHKFLDDKGGGGDKGRGLRVRRSLDDIIDRCVLVWWVGVLVCTYYHPERVGQVGFGWVGGGGGGRPFLLQKKT